MQIKGQEGYVVASDTSVSTVEREISQKKIDNYRSQPAYNYEDNPEYSDNFLSRLWMRFIEWLGSILGGGGVGILGKTIYYGLILLAIISVVVFITRAQGHNPFGRTDRKSRTALAAELVDENTSIESIEDLINKAERSDEYRLAIRLHYLKSLRMLDTAKAINWRSGKTNHDYLLEIKDNNLKEKFDDLSYIYEYSWYGQFEINSLEQYHKLRDPFHSLFHTLNK